MTTLTEYLDYLSINSWEEGCLEKVRAGRECPMELMQRCGTQAAEAERALDRLKGTVAPARRGEWQVLRASARLCRWQCEELRQACLAKVLFAAVRSSVEPRQQRVLAAQCRRAFVATERAQARVREAFHTFPAGHLGGAAVAATQQFFLSAYKDRSFEIGLYIHELDRLLKGEAWTLSLRELSWKGLMVNEIYEESPTAFEEFKKRHESDVPWPHASP